MNNKVMIIAGEASGDLHGAHLVCFYSDYVRNSAKQFGMCVGARSCGRS